MSLPCRFSLLLGSVSAFFFFFFNDTATTEIYTLSLHDALPISRGVGHLSRPAYSARSRPPGARPPSPPGRRDRKSTRLNSSHSQISYAVFCLKKKKKPLTTRHLLLISVTRPYATRPTILSARVI